MFYTMSFLSMWGWVSCFCAWNHHFPFSQMWISPYLGFEKPKYKYASWSSQRETGIHLIFISYPGFRFQLSDVTETKKWQHWKCLTSVAMKSLFLGMTKLNLLCSLDGKNTLLCWPIQDTWISDEQFQSWRCTHKYIAVMCDRVLVAIVYGDMNNSVLCFNFKCHI